MIQEWVHFRHVPLLHDSTAARALHSFPCDLAVELRDGLRICLVCIKEPFWIFSMLCNKIFFFVSRNFATHVYQIICRMVVSLLIILVSFEPTLFRA